MSLQVLLVEDQDDNIEAWKDQAAAHNADAQAKGFLVQSRFAKSVKEAEAALDRYKIDAVVVDLRLQAASGQPGAPNDDGNVLMKHIANTHPVAMAVYSGQRAEADVTDFSQVEVFDRGGGLDPVFGWLGKQREMMAQLRSTRQSIERETARVFFRSIWPRWERWTTNAPKSRPLGETMTRHVVAHVHDSMLYSGGEIAHPEETYFIPPLKDRLDTGDLVRDDEGIWMVVSPRCDMANAKVPTVLVALCSDKSAEWGANEKGRGAMSQHGKAPKWHFLPPMLDVDGKPKGPWYVEFGHLRVVVAADVDGHLTKKRFASLAPQFVPSLVERFGAYFSRIGTPNLASD
jgi:CheY-like chemotaxis protein